MCIVEKKTPYAGISPSKSPLLSYNDWTNNRGFLYYNVAETFELARFALRRRPNRLEHGQVGSCTDLQQEERIPCERRCTYFIANTSLYRDIMGMFFLSCLPSRRNSS